MCYCLFRGCWVKIGLPNAAAHKKGYMDLQEVAREDSISCFYGATLQKDPTCALPCSWAEGDPSLFLIRGQNYLQDRQKVIPSLLVTC